jgi:hypothetical protein
MTATHEFSKEYFEAEEIELIYQFKFVTEVKGFKPGMLDIIELTTTRR